MQVTITRTGALTGGRAPYDETVTLPEGARAGDLLDRCRIDPRTCVVVINGAAVTRGAPLSDGDHVRLYPVQAGG